MPDDRGYKITYRYFRDNPTERIHLVVAYSVEEAIFQFSMGPRNHIKNNERGLFQFDILYIEPASREEAAALRDSGFYGRLVNPT